MVARDDSLSLQAAQDALRALARMPPWLEALADGERVGRSLAAALAGTGERMDLMACQPGRLRMAKGRWSGSYRVTVRPAAGSEPRTVVLRGTDLPSPAPRQQDGARRFGEPGWAAYLPDLGLDLQTEPAEADLPALRVLTDPDAARGLLESAIRAGGAQDATYRLAGCEPRVLRYKPGSRCTILYRLAYDRPDPPAAWPDRVVAKTYQGGKGRVAWEGLQDLWRSPMSSSPVAIAQPLAFVAEHNVLVLGPVAEEQTLKQAIRGALRAGAPADRAVLGARLRAAAAGLADLHRSGVGAGRRLTWEDEMEGARGTAVAVAARVPAVAEATDPLLTALSDLARAHPADPSGPAHGSFRPAQVLLSAQGLAFIDFDGFCQAEPAADLALFRTNVRQLEPEPQHREALAEVADEFLVAYRQRHPVSDVRLALWEALDLLTDVLHCWTKVRPDELPATMAALDRHLAAEPLAVADRLP